jgi:hypothetical protein
MRGKRRTGQERLAVVPRISELSFPIRHWRRMARARIFRAVALERVDTMRTWLIAEGITGLIAAAASYLWGYLDGRAELRARWRAIRDELRDWD